MYNGPGIYRHYKGGFYFVLGLAKHSETSEEMVVYRPLYPTSWQHFIVRPLVMFEQRIPDADHQHRFARVT